MNTTTRASFADANACHASTAQGPLLRPEGVIVPSRPNPTPREAQRAHWAEHPDQHCRAIAAAYERALRDPQLQLPVTASLLVSARRWLWGELSKVTALGFWPDFVERESLLPETLLAFADSPSAQGTVRVPITSLYNVPHPVWGPLENLLFRFVHDYHHHITGADATFSGELAVTRYIVEQPHVACDSELATFLASEPVGQSALFIVSKVYPKQIIAANILEFIK